MKIFKFPRWARLSGRRFSAISRVSSVIVRTFLDFLNLGGLPIRKRHFCHYCKFLRPAGDFQFSHHAARSFERRFPTMTRIYGIVARKFLNFLNLGRLPGQNRYHPQQCDVSAFLNIFKILGPWEFSILQDLGAPSIFNFPRFLPGSMAVNFPLYFAFLTP